MIARAKVLQRLHHFHCFSVSKWAGTEKLAQSASNFEVSLCEALAIEAFNAGIMEDEHANAGDTSPLITFTNNSGLPTETPAPTPTPVPIFEIKGTIYFDADGNSLFSEVAGDRYMDGVIVVLFDHNSGETLQSTQSDRFGDYSFQIEKRDNNVRIRVLRPELNLEFSPISTTGYPKELPVGLLEDGESLRLFAYQDEAKIVNGALRLTPVGVLIPDKVILTDPDPVLQSCDIGVPLADFTPLPSGTLVGLEFKPTNALNNNFINASVTTFGAPDSTQQQSLCTSFDLRNGGEPLPERISDWYFSGSANLVSGGLCATEQIYSIYQDNDWIPKDLASLGGSIIREGNQVNFSYPFSNTVSADFLYLGGVDFSQGVCTSMGLNGEGAAAIPANWDIQHWGEITFKLDTLEFANIGFEFPFDADACNSNINLSYEIGLDGTPTLFATLDATISSSTVYEYKYTFNSIDPDETGGCSTLELYGEFFIPFGF